MLTDSLNVRPSLLSIVPVQRQSTGRRGYHNVFFLQSRRGECAALMINVSGVKRLLLGTISLLRCKLLKCVKLKKKKLSEKQNMVKRDSFQPLKGA